MKVAKGHKKQVIKLASLVKGYVKTPAMAETVMGWLNAQQAMEAKVARLKRLVANDNNKAISYHLVEQLADIISFMALKNNVSEALMTAKLGLAFGVGCLARLRDDQFNAALDYVLTYKAEKIA